MKRLFLLLVALALLLPGASWGADWLKGCQSSQSGTPARPGAYACFEPASSTDDSDGLLDVSACDNFDAIWLLDKNGDGTPSTGSVQLETCPVNDALDTEAEFAAGCRDLGSALDTSNESNLGLAAVVIWANVTGANNDPQLLIKCNIGSE